MRAGQKYAAEFIGTFALVFAGTGAVIINDVTGGAVTNVGVGLTFGRRLHAKIILPYVASQSLGALAASLLLRGLFPQHPTLGATVPAGPVVQSLLLEIVLTALLMFVILNVSIGAKEREITAGIAVGSVIALEALFAGPISDASMNPARSLAPALVSQHLAYLWIYLVAPVAGALLAVLGCRCIRKDCCSAVLHGMVDHPS
jgi:glycerol uptake facilitator-like aquaporin